MALTVGSRLDHYDVTALIGAGGVEGDRSPESEAVQHQGSWQFNIGWI